MKKIPKQEHSLSRETVVRLLNDEIWQPMRREGWRVKDRKARLKDGEAVLAADFHLIQKDDRRGPMLPINAVMVDTGIYFEYIPDFLNIASPDQTTAVACPIRHTVIRDRKTNAGEYLSHWYEQDEASMREALREIKRNIDESMVPLLRQLADAHNVEQFFDARKASMDGPNNLWGFGDPNTEGRNAIRAFTLLHCGRNSEALELLRHVEAWWQNISEPKPKAFGKAVTEGLERASTSAKGSASHDKQH